MKTNHIVNYIILLKCLEKCLYPPLWELLVCTGAYSPRPKVLYDASDIDSVLVMERLCCAAWPVISLC